MTPKKMNKLLIGLISLSIALIAVGLYFANTKLTATAETTAKNKAELEITNAQISSYKITQSKVSSLSYVEELADTVLPAAKDESAIVAELSQFALRSRLSVAEISFAEPATTTKADPKAKSAAPKGVNVVPISVKLKAGAQYNNLLEFLKLVENNRRTMQVTNISITPDEENRAVLSDISIAINLYTRK